MGLLDSRDYPKIRQKFVASVRERHVDASQVKEFEAGVSDLGEGGIFVEMADPPPKGTILELEFSPPSGADPIKVLGIVRWCERAGPNAGVGVRFAPIGESERANISKLIAQGSEGSAPKPPAGDGATSDKPR